MKEYNFRKGASGNPKGMAKGTKNRSTKYKEVIEAMSEQDDRFLKMLLNENSDGMKPLIAIAKGDSKLRKEYKISPYIQARMVCFLDSLKRGDYRAIEAIHDRIYGKPKQAVEITKKLPSAHSFVDIKLTNKQKKLLMDNVGADI